MKEYKYKCGTVRKKDHIRINYNFGDLVICGNTIEEFIKTLNSCEYIQNVKIKDLKISIEK